MKINVRSEIQPLEVVMLHRPGKELENLVPDMLEELLFDDIPYLEVAQAEHDAFADVLRSKGVEVVYILDVLAEAIKDPVAHEELLETFINEAVEGNRGITNFDKAKVAISEFLKQYTDDRELVARLVEGIRTSELDPNHEFTTNDALFVSKPMPNLYFQRDPFVSIGGGVTVNKMNFLVRNRETLFHHIVFKYHPEFKENIPMWYDRDSDYSLEGGDVLVLNDETLIIGLSQRTHKGAILKLADKLLRAESENYKQIIALNIGETRKYMHLDTVFTQVDHDKFTVHPDVITDKMEVIKVSLKDGHIAEESKLMQIKELLEKLTGEDEITLIPCGGGDVIASNREQWNDGANTLAIAPGEVVVYSRNTVTNKILEENGITLNIIPSAELSRGRGGPRCMSMPLYRKSKEK